VPLPVGNKLFGTVAAIVAGAIAGTVGGVTAMRRESPIASSIEAKVDQLLADMSKVKCRLNIDGTCPPADRR
jgi:hypothetical protein